MPRPTKQTVDYFPHQCHHGKTIAILEKRFGLVGYAFWFKLLEKLGATSGHYLVLDNGNIDDWEFLVEETVQDNDKCKEIIDLLARLNAIDRELWEDHWVIWSDNFVAGLAPVYAKRTDELPEKPQRESTKEKESKQTKESIGTIGSRVEIGNSSQTTSGRPKLTTDELASPETDSVTLILKELTQLPGWGNNHHDNDEYWLTEFLKEFPLEVTHIKGCRDYHSSKKRNTVGDWKNRLRNWMISEVEYQAKQKGSPHEKPQVGEHDYESELMKKQMSKTKTETTG